MQKRGNQTPTLTQAEFAKHLNTTFRVDVGDESYAELKLTEVKGYSASDSGQTNMERFSVFFTGPSKPFLIQATYQVKHDKMGEFPLFMVPIYKDSDGYRYEAVFNYFREPPSTK